MPFITLTCPQCSAPLPRQAHWRTVTCPYCHTSVSRSEEVVQAAWFRDANQRVLGALDTPAQTVQVGPLRYGIVQPLGRGAHADVYLAQRISALPERVILKLARPDVSDSGAALARGAQALDALQHSDAAGAPYFTQRLPQTVVLGTARSNFFSEQRALVLRAPPGYWGSLDEVLRRYHAKGQVLDARHAVWMWRRVLEVLAFVHDSGWVHQELLPENLLVHPGDHGVQIIGWSRAARVGSDPAARGRDLAQLAWTVRALLCGGNDPTETDLPAHVPEPLAQLLRQCAEVPWCGQQGARGIDQALRAAALQAFGPPRFLRFDPPA